MYHEFPRILQLLMGMIGHSWDKPQLLPFQIIRCQLPIPKSFSFCHFYLQPVNTGVHHTKLIRAFNLPRSRCSSGISCIIASPTPSSSANSKLEQIYSMHWQIYNVLFIISHSNESGQLSVLTTHTCYEGNCCYGLWNLISHLSHITLFCEKGNCLTLR